ncbi:flagellar motor switch protein FliG [Paramicrobacterium agarici]|uniref:Flagellar motor switch protein FliG n=1 Tax=Paramicrobacterium agarici TaxID=630514 RepID=A0A2A9DV97_9MICO|nr:flagellar motor switch protein FliG [Microbacterium agarici]PFG30608.1 flagellar motor switch protein FliG [Microbacterium agarici]
MTELNGVQKAAIVLMSMDRERAAEVMKQFTEAEAEEITAEIIRIRRVDGDVASLALTEFHSLATQQLFQGRGGREVAAGILEASFGSERAETVMTRVTSSLAGKSFEFLSVADAGQVVSLLDGELPQTIALVLAHLSPAQASTVLAILPDPLRADVAQCIATMGTATQEAISIVAETLKSRTGGVFTQRDTVGAVGGVQPLVDIINRSDAATEKALLESLEARDAELAEDVRSRMLTFADLVRLGERDAQLVLRGTDTTVLATAMKGASAPVTEVIRTNLSERNRELLDDEAQTLGPVRISQVEEARAEIVRVIRTLEAQGDITVQRADEEEYVY